MEKCVYFNDNFFSSGKTDIYNESQERIGEIDLKSAFGSSLNVENERGEVVVEGSFPFFSGRWNIKQSDGTELGEVKSSFPFFQSGIIISPMTPHMRSNPLHFQKNTPFLMKINRKQQRSKK
ncbi:hypothetical protein [Fictibacillus sp. BK138]|uniref:hypothetical protein n=1 Tax=Fictibacillus sp. BK138 TaxID=2512121 RepID=UPI001F5F0237|nr:hypothetical protein [Fictibacillus sp. BK138]